MILDVIVEDKKKRLKEHKARTSEEQMKELALVSERKSISFYEALAKPGLSIIGEFKKASPSMGKIEMTMEFMDRIDEYNISVDAISCLTEEEAWDLIGRIPEISMEWKANERMREQEYKEAVKPCP